MKIRIEIKKEDRGDKFLFEYSGCALEDVDDERLHESSGRREVTKANYYDIVKNLGIIQSAVVQEKALKKDAEKRLSGSLNRISEKLSHLFLPRKGEDAEGEFEEFLLALEDYSKSITPPHVLLKTNEQRIPWWLTKTYDDEGYWGTYYAIGMSGLHTHLSKTTKEDVRIGIISRPTVDLRDTDPITNIIEEKIDEISKYFKLEKKPELIIDGKTPLIIGEKNIKDGIYGLKDNFFGVTEEEIRRVISGANLIIYYGHFVLTDDPLSSFLVISPHPDDVKTRKDDFNEEWGKDFGPSIPPIYDVPERLAKENPEELRKLSRLRNLALESTTSRIEIDTIQPDVKDKHFLLGACASAGVPLKTIDKEKIEKNKKTPPEKSVAEIFLEAECNTFIGTLFPVYASETGDFIKEFFSEAFINKVSLAEALRRTRCNLAKKGVPSIHWMSFSLWGHPGSTFLPKPKLPLNIHYSSSTEHVLSPLFDIIETYPLTIEPELVDIKKLPKLQEEEKIVISECPLPEVLMRLDQGENIVILGSIFEPTQNDCSLVINKMSGIKQLYDSCEKIIGGVSVSRPIVSTTAILYAIIRVEEQNKNVKILDKVVWAEAETDRLHLLKQNIFQGAILLPEELKVIKEEENLFELVQISSWLKNKIGTFLPGPLLIVSKDTFINNIETVKIFIKKYKEAVNLLIKDEQKKTVVAKKLKISEDLIKIHKPCLIPEEYNSQVEKIIGISNIIKGTEIGLPLTNETIKIKRGLTKEDFAYYYFSK